MLSLQNIHKSYPMGNQSLHVLRGIDLGVQSGELVSIMGASGSGKSTILRCANLLEDSQQGEIRFRGETVRWKGSGAGRHPADRAQITRIRTNLSMVFQQFGLLPWRSVVENVALGLELGGMGRAEAAE